MMIADTLELARFAIQQKTLSGDKLHTADSKNRLIAVCLTNPVPYYRYRLVQRRCFRAP